MRTPSVHDPFRPVNWRWERARWLREHGKYVKRHVDDDFTVAAKRFQAEYGRVSDDLDRLRLSARYPGIFHAMEAYQREERGTRWTIEACLLARESPERIAHRAMTSEEVVFWYEKLFFNVTPCLHAPYYIVNAVIGESVHHGLSDREYDVLWKLYGYFGGPFILDHMLTTFAGTQTRPDSADGIAAFWSDDGRMTIHRKAALAARLMPLHNNFTLQVILEYHAKMVEIESRGEGSAGGGRDAILDCVNAMLGTLGGPLGRGGGLLYAGNKPSYVDTPQLEHYDNKAAELRAHEHLSVTLGEDPGDAARGEAEWAFPEPPAAQDEAARQGGQG